MDKKKLIGTIVGVTMFAALIAGATFAWLTITATNTNGVYNASTMNFIINYTSGTAVTDLNIVSDPDASAITTGNGLITVSAGKATGSADGTLYLRFKLDSTSNALITDGAVKYKVCAGSACSGTMTADGSIAAGTTTLYSAAVPATTTNYYIYMWLDASVITDTHMGLTFAGHVYAEATQTD